MNFSPACRYDITITFRPDPKSDKTRKMLSAHVLNYNSEAFCHIKTGCPSLVMREVMEGDIEVYYTPRSEEGKYSTIRLRSSAALINQFETRRVMYKKELSGVRGKVGIYDYEISGFINLVSISSQKLSDLLSIGNTKSVSMSEEQLLDYSKEVAELRISAKKSSMACCSERVKEKLTKIAEAGGESSSTEEKKKTALEKIMQYGKLWGSK